MKIKVIYSKQELQATINFISENNQYFIGQKDFIKDSILESINSLVDDFPDGDLNTGTMGYFVSGEILEEESMNNDENVLYINFLVNPGLACSDLSSDEDIELDSVEEIYLR